MPAFFPGCLTGVDGELDDQTLVGGSDRRGDGANQTACSARL
jgi:hypothetical protein